MDFTNVHMSYSSEYPRRERIARGLIDSAMQVAEPGPALERPNTAIEA